MKGMLMIVKSIFLSWNPVIFSINDLNIQQNVSDSLSGTTVDFTKSCGSQVKTKLQFKI